ncbi:hypothetical protein QJS10_CPB18g00721 [Acorus calamus]|uniref:Uncharacterized protein n=1 Tax=Acorus calamus TaxID=4465 RepID=A0AAV9CNI8_ACOCL|nr:hypothetical protein QJS10_CPB18g00721 [Acorus calamus]
MRVSPSTVSMHFIMRTDQIDLFTECLSMLKGPLDTLKLPNSSHEPYIINYCLERAPTTVSPGATPISIDLLLPGIPPNSGDSHPLTPHHPGIQ